MTSTINTTTSNITIDSTTLDLENLTLISDSSSTTSATTASDNSDNTMIELENSIGLLEEHITPLITKTQKKLAKIEDEIVNCNFLINSGLGSKKDQAELRKSKRQLRQRRIKVWDELKVLPALKEEKSELERQLNDLRRQLGVLADF